MSAGRRPWEDGGRRLWAAQVAAFVAVVALAAAMAWLTYPRLLPRPEMPRVEVTSSAAAATSTASDRMRTAVSYRLGYGSGYQFLVRVRSRADGGARDVFLADYRAGDPMPTVVWTDATHIRVAGHVLDVRTASLWIPRGPAAGFMTVMSLASMSAWVAVVVALLLLVTATGICVVVLPRWLRAQAARSVVEQLFLRLARRDLHAAARLLSADQTGLRADLADSALARRVAGATSWKVGRVISEPRRRYVVLAEVNSADGPPTSVEVQVTTSPEGPRILLA